MILYVQPEADGVAVHPFKPFEVQEDHEALTNLSSSTTILCRMVSSSVQVFLEVSGCNFPLFFAFRIKICSPGFKRSRQFR